MTDFDLTAFYGQFRDETWENLDLVEQGLTAWEAQPEDRALLDRMLRAIHTTKGSAKIMGFTEINQLAHEVEEVLSALGQGTVPLTPAVGNLLLEASGAIRRLTEARLQARRDHGVDVAGLLQALRRTAGAPEEAESAAPREETAAPVVTTSAPAGPRRETMRVDLERIDLLAHLVGETLSLHQQALAEQSALQEQTLIQAELRRSLDNIKDRLRASRDRLLPRQAAALFQTLHRLEDTVSKLEEQWRHFRREHDVLLERTSLTLNALHDEALTIRMLPIGTLFEIFPGVVRRMAGECGIEVSLEVRGSEVELDRRVLDILREPLIHLMRNALDHGIEPPEERLQQGKPRRGQIVLEAWQRGRRIDIRISDDGRGIDLEAVRRTAVEQGLLEPARAQEADKRTLLDLLLHPGFTTRQQVTDMSGRGVGLDVVQAAARRLNGLLRIDTRPGQGTTFTLDVPLTLAAMRVLLVGTAEQTWALPAAAVHGLVRIRRPDLIMVEGQPTLQWQQQDVPVVPLADMLGLASPGRPPSRQPAVITGSNGRQIALTVDRILDETEVVVQPLRGILTQSPYFSAATLSGRGQVVPILDLNSLLAPRSTASTPASRQPVVAAPPSAPPSILLVEDAITTRELERSILEAAGYEVEAAFDGLDALRKMEERSYQLVITDIEMPRMDGFELTDQMRQDPRWADVPVVIITARENEQDRRRGLQLGAQAYIVKSRFDQRNLLETIEQLVG